MTARRPRKLTQAALARAIGAGAVQFVTEERLPAILASFRRAGEVEWLSEEQLIERIERLANDATAGRQ